MKGVALLGTNNGFLAAWLEVLLGRSIFFEVERRDAATLLRNIQHFIEPESVIASDMWKGYDRIENLPQGYQHIRVNHSENFVNPDNPTAHTQSIESLWQKFKQRH